MTIRDLRTRMFDNSSMEEFTDVFHVNVTGAYFTLLAFLELLDAGNRNAIKGGFGTPLIAGTNVPSIQSQVIINSSVSAYSRDKQCPPAHIGSKSAIAHLTKHASTNLAKYEIRVNGLLPGFIPSETSESIISTRDPGKEGPDNEDYIPVRRFGGIEEMAGSVLYLASRAGSFCNGLMLLNDGGRICVMNSEYKLCFPSQTIRSF
ncbi:hypothetical protein LZ30DRAFT_731353 [Colletotrichum cereale]|nr:hypothetical protein LZ30DRAFT_731353 [Colletotrichum cereale]